MNIYLEDMTGEQVKQLHEIVLELHGKFGSYVNQLVEIEDYLFLVDDDE